jgi:UDP-N-acetylglucosamine--N-acetylmuramyl-(pentapeptide) pyrophosphoryl-undecaprenol N-acetylglucosamine transferase
MNHILIMAGGTGGHVFPGLAVARVLRAQGSTVSWLGTAAGLETRVVPAANLDIRLETIEIRGLRRSGLANWLLLPPRLLRALWQAFGVLRRLRPDAVLSMGGYVAGPGGVMAWLLRTPLVLHEQNAIPGLTNRWLALLARRVLTGFPGVFSNIARARHVGNPVREDIRRVAAPETRLAGRSGRLRLLVVGGSQGARVFNEIVPQALRQLPAGQRPEVWHQCGRQQQVATERDYAGVNGMRVTEFIDDMAQAYDWADLVLARAGAMTLAELAAAGVAAILVPYPYAVDDHQTANARFLETHDAAMLLPQAEFTPARLAEILDELSGNRAALLDMARAARACDMSEAAETVAQECIEAAHA